MITPCPCGSEFIAKPGGFAVAPDISLGIKALSAASGVIPPALCAVAPEGASAPSGTPAGVMPGGGADVPPAAVSPGAAAPGADAAAPAAPDAGAAWPSRADSASSRRCIWPICARIARISVLNRDTSLSLPDVTPESAAVAADATAGATIATHQIRIRAQHVRIAIRSSPTGVALPPAPLASPMRDRMAYGAHGRAMRIHKLEISERASGDGRRHASLRRRTAGGERPIRRCGGSRVKRWMGLHHRRSGREIARKVAGEQT